VERRDPQRIFACCCRRFEIPAQIRIRDLWPQQFEQCAYVYVLRDADVGGAVIFLRRHEHQRGHDLRHALPILRGDLRGVFGGKFQPREHQYLIGFGLHAAPRRSARILLWKVRQYQPENAFTGSVLRPSAYSRAAEIQMASPLRLAKISHQARAAVSSRMPLSFCQMESASSRGMVPAGREGSPWLHNGSMAQPKSSSGFPRCAISQSRIARML